MSDAPSGSLPGRPRWQFGLRSLLVAFLLLGLGLGWYLDHRRSALTIQMQAEQLAALQSQLAERHGQMGTVYWWASADEFMKMLRHNEDEDKFGEMAASYGRSDDMSPLMPQMRELLNDPNERTRERALNVVRFAQVARPEYMQAFADELIPLLVERLDDSSSRVQGTAIATLQEFGPEASPALKRLHAMLADDDCHYNALAAEAISQIDPDYDITPRLVELVRKRSKRWSDAAWTLATCGEPTRARQCLQELYAQAGSKEDRERIVSYLNQIKAE